MTSAQMRQTIQQYVSQGGTDTEKRYALMLDVLENAASVAADENDHPLKAAIRRVTDRFEL